MSDRREELITDDPEYKASVERLEEAIRSHHRLVEDWGNEHGETEEEHSMVAGWVLVMGQIGYDSGREFHAALVEYPDSTSSFLAIGLVDYARRFLASQTADYSTMADE